jgi:hypothetical protein
MVTTQKTFREKNLHFYAQRLCNDKNTILITSRIQGQNPGSGFRSQGKDSGLGFRVRIQGQDSGMYIKLKLPQWIEAVAVAFYSSSWDQIGHLERNSFQLFFNLNVFI